MKLVEIEGFFQMDIGAPMPLLLSDEKYLKLIFLSDFPFNEISNADFQQEVIEIRFERCRFHSLGPPNDEALNGHPYYMLGLRSYSFSELLDSDLIVELNHYNRYHPYYNPKAFDKTHHYILSFKDTLFECVALGYDVIKHKLSYYQSIQKLFNNDSVFHNDKR